MQLFSEEVEDRKELKQKLENNRNIVDDYEVAVIVYAFDKDNKIILTTHQQFEDYYYANFEVDSLDFLPQLEQDLLKIKSSIMGLIFSTIEDGTYEINIYDGYLD